MFSIFEVQRNVSLTIKKTIMKKTNEKGSVKNLKGLVINQHQKEMDKIVNEMAVLFEKKISASKLAKWLALANHYSDDRIEIIFDLGYGILPGLINAKDTEDKVNFLKQNLLATLGFDKAANKSVYQLCENYFKENNGRLIFIEEIEEFMEVCLTLFAICEMFEEYVYHRQEMEQAA